jgi:hypothetical protein
MWRAVRRVFLTPVYTWQVISTELNRVVVELLQQLLFWQERAKAASPHNVTKRKRLVSGLRCGASTLTATAMRHTQPSNIPCSLQHAAEALATHCQAAPTEDMCVRTVPMGFGYHLAALKSQACAVPNAAYRKQLKSCRATQWLLQLTRAHA